MVHRSLYMKHGIIQKFIIFCFSIQLLSCAVNPATGEQDFVLMSETEELAIGRTYSKQVMTQYRRYDNQSLQRYIQSVGDRLAISSHRKNIVYRFTLLDSTQVNAFALPGGYIYITRGLLAYLNSEAELAAVLAHEIGHVTARHSVRQHSASTATNLLGAIAAAATGIQGVGQLSNLLATGIIRGYGREHELEADRLGVQYLARSGYSPSAMKNVITTLKNQELFDQKLALEQGRKPRAYHGVFSTHPANDKRLLEVINGARNLAVKSSPILQDHTFLRKLNGLTFGDSAADGIVRGDTFYHAPMDFKVSFAKNWFISNRPNAITAEAPKGLAMLQMAVQDINKRLTPKQFLSTRLGLKKPLSELELNIAGFKGYSAVVLGKSPYGERRVRASVILAGSRAFVFFGSAKSSQGFSRYDSFFLRSVRSFARLTKKDRVAAKELKLNIIKVRRSTGFGALAKLSPITYHAEDQLRLLNDAFPKGTRKQGDLIKVVR